MGFIRVLFSSPKRIAQASFVFLAILAVPLTLTLVKERQDLRQRASGPIPVTSSDYNTDGNINGKAGYNAVFDPTQGGWIYVPVDQNTGEQLPYGNDTTQTSLDDSCGQPCEGDGACGGGSICVNRCCTAGLTRCGDKTCDSATQDCATGGSRFSETMCITKGTCVQNFNCFAPNYCNNNTCQRPSNTTTPAGDTGDTAIVGDSGGNKNNSSTLKITLQSSGTGKSGVSLTLELVANGQRSTGSVVGSLTQSKTTDSSGVATFTIPRSVSSSICRDYGITSVYCSYFDNYFRRNFSYNLKVTTPNIVFSDNNNQTQTISSLENKDLTFQVTDNTPTATPTLTPTITTTPPSTTYSCDFDGQNGPDLPDYTIWLGEFRSGQKNKADCDNNGVIDIFDYAMWLGEFKKKNAEQ